MKVNFSKFMTTCLALDFLKCLLEKDPLKRITIKEALKHPFVTKYNF